jgi:hypothetical protein
VGKGRTCAVPTICSSRANSLGKLRLAHPCLLQGRLRGTILAADTPIVDGLFRLRVPDRTFACNSLFYNHWNRRADDVLVIPRFPATA